MTTETTTTTTAASAEEKISQLRELFADAPRAGPEGAREGAQQAGVGCVPEAAAAGCRAQPGRSRLGKVWS